MGKCTLYISGSENWREVFARAVRQEWRAEVMPQNIRYSQAQKIHIDEEASVDVLFDEREEQINLRIWSVDMGLLTWRIVVQTHHGVAVELGGLCRRWRMLRSNKAIRGGNDS